MKKCDDCTEVFKWDDDVVDVGGMYFHKACVELVPSAHVAFAGDEFIGEVEDEDLACLFFSKGEYKEEGEE